MNGSPSDPLAQLLSLPIGTPVRLVVNGRSWEGWTLPPDPLSSPRVLKLKVGSGYNVGVHVPENAEVEVRSGPPFGEERNPQNERAQPSSSAANDGPRVLLLATGGTIASRVDYQTGGVRPVQSPEDLADVYPGLFQDGPVELRTVSEIFSEDMTPADWTRLAREVDRGFHEGSRGVVIAHGTDTLAYTAAALAFQPRLLAALDFQAFQGGPDAGMVAETPSDNQRLIEGLLQGDLGPPIREASPALLLEKEGPEAQLVGFVLALEDNPHRALIADVAVLPTFRGQGLGRALLVRSLRGLIALGFSDVLLWVTEANAAAQRLYRSAGFTALRSGHIFRWTRSQASPSTPSLSP
jgi:ribosomal protein S18 acetylase RimI-like enzyme